MKHHRALPAVVVVSAFMLASTARAAPPTAKVPPPKKEQCFDAHERAQVAHKEGRLKAAREDFQICANAACPKLVSTECSEALAKIATEVPSVIVDARDASGAAASGARLSVDGGAETEPSGATLELEPGEHSFRLVAGDGRTVEKRLTLKPGDRDVKLSLELPASKKSEAPAPKPETPKSAPKRGPSTLVWVMGGVAVVGLAGFVGFGLSGKGKQSDLDACKPDCARKDVDSMRQSYLFADISLGVALVAGGVGAYLYMSSPKTTEKAVWVRAVPEARGAGARIGASF